MRLSCTFMEIRCQKVGRTHGRSGDLIGPTLSNAMHCIRQAINVRFEMTAMPKFKASQQVKT